MKGGDLKVDPIRLTYKGATITGRGSIDGSARSAVKVRLLAQKFDLGSFLKDQEVPAGVAGDVDFGLDVSSKGTSPRAIIASLDGTASSDRLTRMVRCGVWVRLIGSPPGGRSRPTRAREQLLHFHPS